MNIVRCISFGLVCLFIFLATSCGTTGGKQVETVIYDMHRRVTKLDKGFDGINTTFADLSVKLQENEQTMKSLQSVIEENQVKISQLSKDLNELKTTLYRHLNLSVGGVSAQPSTSGAPKEAMGNVEILPPSSAQAPPIQVPPSAPTVPTQTTASAPKTGAPAPKTEAPNPPVTTTQPQTIAEPPAEQATTTIDPKEDYNEAQKLFANEKYEEAFVRFDKHIKMFPTQETTPNAIFWKAKSLMNLNKYQEAIQEFDVLKNNYPNHQKIPTALQNQAVAYSRLGQNDRAIQILKELIDKYPLSAAAEQAKSDLEKLQNLSNR
ncbi:MAG TPA: tol-pal system protein YbgF [Candidatus Hydrogenedens sp.]|nr:tol-pal system protein YbgF [Candidatus Hydrogenedens sp.]